MSPDELSETYGDAEACNAEEMRLLCIIHNKRVHHHHFPVGMGSGRSSLVREVQAWLHQLLFETGDTTLLRDLLHCYVSGTTDQGDEPYPKAKRLNIAICFDSSNAKS